MATVAEHDSVDSVRNQVLARAVVAGRAVNASTVRRTSSSSVRQHETEMRIAARPSHDGRAHPGLALLLHRGDDRRRPLVVLEAEEHLVEDDVVEDLAARQRRRAPAAIERAWAQLRSISVGDAAAPSARIAAHTGSERARRENSGL